MVFKNIIKNRKKSSLDEIDERSFFAEKYSLLYLFWTFFVPIDDTMDTIFLS